jgi:hypothetical protein
VLVIGNGAPFGATSHVHELEIFAAGLDADRARSRADRRPKCMYDAMT